MTDKERIERAVESMPVPSFFLRNGRNLAPAVRETQVPGVYRFKPYPRRCRVDESEDADEGEAAVNRWYIFASSVQRAREVFSDEVLAMGEEDDGLWFSKSSCRFSVQYELFRYLQRIAPEQERWKLEREALTCALFGGEDESAYFGEWTPPESTPNGHRTRYRRADSGVWFVEGGGTWFLASVRPLVRHMDDETLRLASPYSSFSRSYAFWSLDACAPAVYQLLYDEEREGLSAWITSQEDLVNAIWRAHPAFARERKTYAEVLKTFNAENGRPPLDGLPDFTRTGPGDRAFLRGI